MTSMAKAPASHRFLLEGQAPLRSAVVRAAESRGLALAEADGDALVQTLLACRPASLFLDADLPGDAGFAMLAAIRHRPELRSSRVVLLTADTSETCRQRAYAEGADEVLHKPYDLDQLLAAESDAGRFRLHFWGTRGTLPMPGEQSLKYGGNTSCVSLDIGRDRHFVFDAGTGLRRYSRYLLEREGGRFDGRIFISHPHWDHLNCLPFFAPFYRLGNRITLMGPPQGERSFRDLLEGQMDGVYFPITLEAFGAALKVEDLHEGEHRFDGVSVRTLRLRHPGNCLGFRIDHAGRSMAYITDNELGEPAPDDVYVARLARFLSGVDVLIHDTTYFDDEYPRKVNWGHSSVGQVVRLALQAEVRKLILFHHDPEHDDADIERKLGLAQALADSAGARLQCALAVEGETLDLGQPLPDASASGFALAAP